MVTIFTMCVSCKLLSPFICAFTACLVISMMKMTLTRGVAPLVTKMTRPKLKSKRNVRGVKRTMQEKGNYASPFSLLFFTLLLISIHPCLLASLIFIFSSVLKTAILIFLLTRESLSQSDQLLFFFFLSPTESVFVTSTKLSRSLDVCARCTSELKKHRQNSIFYIKQLM